MASIFYKRYIPPRVKYPDEDDQHRPAKRRKKKKIAPFPLPEQPQIAESSVFDVATEDQCNGHWRPESKGVERYQPDQQSPNRHQNVFDKYEKAAKKSAESKEHLTILKDNDESGKHDKVDVESHGLEPLPQPAQFEEARKVSAFSALPEWLQSPTIVSFTDAAPLSSLPLEPEILESLNTKGYMNAFAIQSAVIPMLLPGAKHHSGDICISAATGSGKTLAYALPMVQALRGKPVTRLRGLVVVPTRELVTQAKETIDLCSSGTGLKVGTAVGSKSLKDEQILLVEKGQRYDPEAHKVEQEKEIDEDEELMDWDFDKKFGPNDNLMLFHNHVVEYTSKVDILICTPGRLVEHIQSTTGFTLENVQWLVVDEVDGLLNESFQQWVDVVLPGLEHLPLLDPILERLFITYHWLRRRELRKIILSATMTRDISKLITLKLRRPRLVVLEAQSQGKADDDGNAITDNPGERIEIPATLQEFGVPIPEKNTQDKPLYLISVLEARSDPLSGKSTRSEALTTDPSQRNESHNSSEEIDSPVASIPSSKRATLPNQSTSDYEPSNHGHLIFTESNEQAIRLARLLALLRPNWQIGTLTKSASGSSGRKTLTAFRKRKLSILIASDRASRGLDIPGLAQVINYDTPKSARSYVHRVGRTARAGKSGEAITLVLHNQARWFWKEPSGIAKSVRLVRGLDRKVVRKNLVLEVTDEEREKYEKALATLGQEAKG